MSPARFSFTGRPGRHRFQQQRLLGTVVDVVVDGFARPRAESVATSVFGEFTRLERCLSAYDPQSELCRWRRGDPARAVAAAGGELAQVMGRTLHWQHRSGGLFNPLVGELTELWGAAEADGRLPDADRLASVARSIVEPRYEMIDGAPVAVGDCARLNLNAIAKGSIVDRVVELAGQRFGFEESGRQSMVVSAGGDIRHLGGGASTVGIEDPSRPYENAPPLTTVELSNGALATSGSSRRGFEIAGTRFSHLLDPRTGQPADARTAVSVIAPNAETADVVATVAALLPPGEAVDFVDEIAGVDGLVVTADGEVHRTPDWPSP